MRICFPVAHSEGLESRVFGQLGSSPRFVVVDTETQEVHEVANRERQNAHGSCSPLRALGGQVVDVVMVGGIGGGALMGLNRAVLKVYQAQGVTIADNLDVMAHVELPEMKADQVCGEHGHGCGH